MHDESNRSAVADGEVPAGFVWPSSARTMAAGLLAPLKLARRGLAVHFVLAFNAGAMALATMANGVFGFVYWWVAARWFTPTAVGLASADISLIILLSMVAEIGLGTMLQGEIPRRQNDAPNLISAALLGSFASAVLFGLAYLSLFALFAPSFASIGAFFSTRLLVVVCIAVQTTSTVLDAALMGMLRGTFRLLRNLLFAVTKLLVVLSFAALVIPPDWQLNAIIASWVIGQCLASLALALILRAKAGRIWHRPSSGQLQQLLGVSFWHYFLNAAAAVPSLVLPIVIAVALSPEQTAPFYAAWMLLALAGTIPTALATVLFTLGSHTSDKSAASTRFSIRVSLGVCIVGAIGFWLLSNVALGVLNPAYPALVGSDLRLLGASLPASAVKVHYMAVQRLNGRVRQAAFVLAAFAVIEIAFAIVGARSAGLSGATGGWVLAMAIEAACLWLTLSRRLGEGASRSRTATEKSVLAWFGQSASPLVSERNESAAGKESGGDRQRFTSDPSPLPTRPDPRRGGAIEKDFCRLGGR
jgi:O-antigen/teichoic acid export membrane protein